jgi:hypothetical protein
MEGHLENRLGRLLRGELRQPLTSPVSAGTSCDAPVERRVGAVGRVNPHLETDGITSPRARGEVGALVRAG